MKTGRSWDGSCCRGARKSCWRGGSTTRLRPCCALATLNYKQCALLPVRSLRSVSNERAVGVTFRYSRTVDIYDFANARRQAASAPCYRRDARSRTRSRKLQIFTRENRPSCRNGQVCRSRCPQKTGRPLPIRSPRCQLPHTELSRCPLPSHHSSKLAEAQTV